MTIADWMVNSMIKLKQAQIPNGRTDVLVLLSDLFNKDKSWVHAHPETELDDLQKRELDYKLNKRLKHMPLAYIRGFANFYGRQFMVNTKVLVPRPESESFIEILKDLEFESPVIADIGTGSGCLGITAQLEIPDAVVDLYDIDPKALAVAEHNAAQYELKLQFYQSDLLSGLRRDYEIIIANLPYVQTNNITSPEIEQEPSIAIFSGKDGLDHYRKFWKEILSLKTKPKYILTESLEPQHGALEAMAEEAGYKLEAEDLLVQLFEISY